MLRRTGFFSSIAAIYILTLGTIGALLYSSHAFGTPAWATPMPQVVQAKPAPIPVQTISGKPVRVVVESNAVDLVVEDGNYDPNTQAWTLSENNAQFATMTALANDTAGMTYIYGHGTDAVFGRIGTNRPPAGTIAKVHTDNGKVFTYSLTEIRDLSPSDTAIFNDALSGPPRLVLQTCTGMFSEWRTIFTFKYDGVVG